MGLLDAVGGVESRQSNSASVPEIHPTGIAVTVHLPQSKRETQKFPLLSSVFLSANWSLNVCVTTYK